MTSVLLIEGQFPTLNDVLKEHGVSPFAYAKTKRAWENKVALVVRAKDRRGPEWAVPAFRSVVIHYRLLEKSKRRDPSNVAAVAIKFIEDALVELCVIPGDGWSSILSFSVTWEHAPAPGVLVTINGETYDEPRQRIYERKLQEKRAKGLGRPKPPRPGTVRASKRPKPVR